MTPTLDGPFGNAADHSKRTIPLFVVTMKDAVVGLVQESDSLGCSDSVHMEEIIHYLTCDLVFNLQVPGAKLRRTHIEKFVVLRIRATIPDLSQLGQSP